MSAEHSIRELLEKGEFVWAPCVYDCLSARCAELVGHNAVLVSSCELEYAMNGIPAGMYNWEEYIYAAERICNSTKLPVIIDGENGGGTPMQVYRNVKRLADDLGVKRVRVVANKVRDARDEDFIRKSIPAADLLGCIHYNPEIMDADRQGKSPYDFCPAAIEEIRKIKAILDSDDI